MTIRVRYLPEDEIEKEAELLLAEYAETIGVPVKLPIPVDEITTYHLALRLGFADLHETLRIPKLYDQSDILGAILVDQETVLIDDSLNPILHPSMAGRYRFSVGHEVGHWRLHRPYIAKDFNQGSLLEGTSEPTVICRSSLAKEPIEWQAEYFSSCLLMPRTMVIEAWRERFGDVKPVTFDEWRGTRMATRPSFNGLRKIGDVLSEVFEPQHKYLFANVAKAFAPDFGVSVQAMRIRLETLGLLLQQAPRQSSFPVSG